jgi:hypothetical protein
MPLATSVTVHVIAQKITDTRHVKPQRAKRFEVGRCTFKNKFKFVLLKIRPLGRPRFRWEDNIKMDFQEVGGCGGDWMELAQDRDRWRALVGTVRNFRVS